MSRWTPKPIYFVVLSCVAAVFCSDAFAQNGAPQLMPLTPNPAAAPSTDTNADPTTRPSELVPIDLKTALTQPPDPEKNQYPIDLAAVLKLVETQNLTVNQSQKNAEVMQARYRQRQVAILPNIDASYAQSRLEGGQQVFGEVVTVTRKTVQPQIGASWTIYPGGQTIFDMLAAKRRKNSADATFKGTYQEQLSLAAQDYYKLIAAHQQRNVAASSVAQAEEQVASNLSKVKTGKGIPLDLSRAQTTYAQQKTALVQAQNNIILAEQSLLNRLNLEPVIRLVPPPAATMPKELHDINVLQTTLVPENVTTDRMLKEAIEGNPLIQSGDEELKALGYDYKSVRSTLIPSVTLRAYVSKTGPDWDNLLRTTFGGLTVNMNLLQNMGLQIPFQMQERKKLIEQKVLAQQQLARDITTRVMTAYLGSENNKSLIESARQEVASAKDSYDLAVGRFNAGYGINIDVLDAQAALATARNNLVQAILNYNQSQVQLVEAMGLISSASIMQGIDISGTDPAQAGTGAAQSPANQSNTQGITNHGQQAP